MTFSIGDRVIVTHSYDGNEKIVGMCGVVIEREKLGGKRYAVRFDEDVDGHSCGGRCADGRGWWVPGQYLEPECDESIPVPSFDDMF